MLSISSDSKPVSSNSDPNLPQRPSRGDSLPTPTPPSVHASLPPVAGIPTTVPLSVQKKSSTAPLSTTATAPAVVVPAIISTSETPSSAVTSPVSVEPPTTLAPTLGASLAPQPRDRRAARESRISLPDEAARYIAAMGDSPVGSPGFGDIPAGGPSATADPTEQAAQAEEFGIGSESLSIDGEATVRAGVKNGGPLDEEEHTPVPVEVSYPAIPERPPPPPPMGGNETGYGHGPKQPHAYGHGINGMGRNGSFDYNDAATPMPTQLTYASQQQQHPMYASQQQQQQQQSNQHQTPPSRPQLHTQPSGSSGRPSMQQMSGNVGSLSNSQLSSPADSTTPMHSEYTRDLKETYQVSQSTPGQTFRDVGFYDTGSQTLAQHPRANQHISPPQSHSSSASPPRLHPSWLPGTHVRILGSNIRSNERGKDVLSFLICVYPPTSYAHNQSAEEWKLEKMYSDVLALDASVRSALGRSQAKKLPPLPDAKLFKDNAPAKVDQRRVSCPSSVPSFCAHHFPGYFGEVPPSLAYFTLKGSHRYLRFLLYWPLQRR